MEPAEATTVKRTRPWSKSSRPCLGIVPLAMVVVAVVCAPAIGPHWYVTLPELTGAGPGRFNFQWPLYDPEYVYLLNALNLLEGATPVHNDHPGTPLQVLMAAVVGLRYLVAGEAETLRVDVLGNPEAYLRTCWAVLLAILAASSAWLGASARRLTGSTTCALATQAAVLTSTPALWALQRTTPEPLLLAGAMLLGGIVLRIAATPEPTGPRRWRGALAVGSLVGVATAVKVTFSPLFAAALLLPRSLRWKAVMSAATAGAFVLALLPIVGRWSLVAEWLRDLFWASGRYGIGARTIVNRGAYAWNLRTLIQVEPALAASIALGVIALIGVALACWRGRTPDHHHRLRGMLGGVVLAQALVLVIGAKMTGVRHLTPAAGLLGVTVAALWVHAARLPRPGARGARGLLLALVAAGLVIQGRTVIAGLNAAEGRALIRRQAAEALEALGPEARIITAYGTSGEGTGLNFAVYWSGNRYGEEVRRLHPTLLHRPVDPGGRYVREAQRPRPRAMPGGDESLYGYGREQLTGADLLPLARSGRLYAIVTPRYANVTGLRLEPIGRFGHETLYRVLPE